MSAELLRDLARAKVAFQLRAIEAVIRGPAQVGRSAKCQDNEDWLGPKGEHAVHEVDAPNQSHISISNPTETGE